MKNTTWRHWTPEEDAIIREVYPRPLGGRLCFELLEGRTIKAVWARAHFLGVKGEKIKKGSTLCHEYNAVGQAKGPLNRCAKVWQFENKSLGVVISGTNLAHLVSEHAYLFDSKDVERVYRGRYTRAEMCLRSLGENGKKTRNSWKGWVFLRKSPGTARDSLDFIGVRYIDSEKQEAAA